MLTSYTTWVNFKIDIISPQVAALVNTHRPLYIITRITSTTPMSLPFLKANPLVYAVAPQETKSWLYVVPLLLEEATSWVTCIAIDVRGNIV